MPPEAGRWIGFAVNWYRFYDERTSPAACVWYVQRQLGRMAVKYGPWGTP